MGYAPTREASQRQLRQRLEQNVQAQRCEVHELRQQMLTLEEGLRTKLHQMEQSVEDLRSCMARQVNGRSSRGLATAHQPEQLLLAYQCTHSDLHQLVRRLSTHLDQEPCARGEREAAAHQHSGSRLENNSGSSCASDHSNDCDGDGCGESSDSHQSTRVNASAPAAAEEPCSAKAIRVSGAEDILPTRMGLFNVATVDAVAENGGRPVYSGERGSWLYYWEPFGAWRIGANYTDVDANVCSLDSESTWCPTRASTWFVWDSGAWLPQYHIVVTAIQPEDHLSVGCVVLSGAESVQPARMGLFSRTGVVPVLENAGRPIFWGGDSVYLYYWADYGAWRVGADYRESDASICSRDHEETWCPTRASAWLAWEDQGWTSSHPLTVREAEMPLDVTQKVPHTDPDFPMQGGSAAALLRQEFERLRRGERVQRKLKYQQGCSSGGCSGGGDDSDAATEWRKQRQKAAPAVPQGWQ